MQLNAPVLCSTVGGVVAGYRSWRATSAATCSGASTADRFTALPELGPAFITPRRRSNRALGVQDADAHGHVVRARRRPYDAGLHTRVVGPLKLQSAGPNVCTPHAPPAPSALVAPRTIVARRGPTAGLAVEPFVLTVNLIMSRATRLSLNFMI